MPLQFQIGADQYSSGLCSIYNDWKELSCGLQGGGSKDLRTSY